VTPYYEDDFVTIYHADCRELKPVACDVVLTDPPYGVEGGRGGDARDYGKAKYQASWSDNREYIADVCVPVIESLRLSTARMAVTPGIRNLFFYPEPEDVGCFWTPAAATHGPWGFTTFQPILYYGKDFRAGKGALPSGKAVTEIAEKNGHPCPKPISAWTWLLEKVSQPGETVFDPFMGSGTTLRAAKDLGRKAIGCEIEERYCEVAVKRLAQEVLWAA
jgi:DNA modification methylase